MIRATVYSPVEWAIFMAHRNVESLKDVTFTNKVLTMRMMETIEEADGTVNAIFVLEDVKDAEAK